MYTFSQLLIRNAILAGLFLLAIFVFSFILFSNHLTNKNKLYSQQISALMQSVNENSDIVELAKIINKSNNYLVLSITTKQGDKLYSTPNKKINFILELVSPAVKKVIINNSKLVVSFQKDYTDELTFVSLLMLILALTTSLFIYVAAMLSNKRYRQIFNQFSQQIKNEISSVINPKVDATDPQLLEIPELKKGLLEIHELIESQKENSALLEKEAYTEPLTKLFNRNRFIQYYEHSIAHNTDIKCGVLIITRSSELQTINQIHGFNEGDQYICAISDILKNAIEKYSSAQLFRLNSSDFASVIPNVRLKEAESFAREITSKFNDYQHGADIDSVAYSGLVFFDKEKPLGELLALADTGISIAQTQQLNSWYSQKDDDIATGSSSSYGNQNWRQEIDSVIENQRVKLLVQQIQPNSRNTNMYGEILARFLNSNEEILPTASFIAMAEKLDRIVGIDKLIIDTAINEITDKNLNEHSFGINISSRTIHDEQFLVWLERRLLREPNIAPRLIFEISEYGLQQNIRTSKRFIDMLHRVGSRVTVERFGVGLTSFKFFRDLKPDFVKMDSTYTRDIDDDKNNQYFLRLMVDLAHRLSINVLTESVESQEEKHALEKLFVDGCQGFYIGKPSPM